MDENEVTEEGREERARYQRRPFTFDRTVRIFFTIAVVLAVLWLVGYLKGVLLPFVVACLICYMLEPVVKWNMRWTRCRKRFLPVILTLLEATVLIGGLIMVTVPYLVSECQDMALTIKKFATTQISIPYLSESWHRIIRENIDFDELSRLLSRELNAPLLSYTGTCIFLSVTSPSLIKQKLSLRLQLPALSDLTSAPSKTIPASYFCSMKYSNEADLL